MREFNVNDILAKIQTVSQEKGIRLTYTNMMVYLKLIEYAKKNESAAVNYYNSVRFSVTTVGLAKYCSVAPRMITDTLNKLSECGIIKYKINKPKPSIVTLLKCFYEDLDDKSICD